MRAAIDCGSNSIRLLIVDGEGTPVVQELRITRLGQGVDATRSLHPDAIDRTIAALAEYRKLMDEHNVTSARAVATSAARDAKNGDDFLRAARAVLRDIDLDVLSGDQEAALTFSGAAQGVPLTGPVLVVDIGGGSTELAFGEGQAPAWATSLDTGCVRLTEQSLHQDPYETAELAAAKQTVADLLATTKISQIPAGTTLVGVAGTITTLAAVHFGIERYQPDIVHGRTLALDDVDAVLRRLAAMTNAQRLGIPLLPPGRADVIVAGAVILFETMQAGGFKECLVSERDLLTGLV